MNLSPLLFMSMFCFFFAVTYFIFDVMLVSLVGLSHFCFRTHQKQLAAAHEETGKNKQTYAVFVIFKSALISVSLNHSQISTTAFCRGLPCRCHLNPCHTRDDEKPHVYSIQ